MQATPVAPPLDVDGWNDPMKEDEKDKDADGWDDAWQEAMGGRREWHSQGWRRWACAARAVLCRCRKGPSAQQSVPVPQLTAFRPRRQPDSAAAPPALSAAASPPPAPAGFHVAQASMCFGGAPPPMPLAQAAMPMRAAAKSAGFGSALAGGVARAVAAASSAVSFGGAPGGAPRMRAVGAPCAAPPPMACAAAPMCFGAAAAAPSMEGAIGFRTGARPGMSGLVGLAV